MTLSRTDWFTQSRFGMFVHWGLYSNPAGMWKGRRNSHPYSEWLQASEHVPRREYSRLAALFNPRAFDADEWIAEARNAGMKYFLITAKHHDGFALWPSKVSAYNVMDASPFGRDILKELTDACRRQGLRIGFYYSHWMDWEGTGGDVCDVYMVNKEYVHPTQRQFERYWQTKCLPQIRELSENYEPAFFWFDSWGAMTSTYITDKRQRELIDLIRQLDNKCLVNSRIRFDSPAADVDFLSTMDNCFPEKGLAKPWETSGTLNHSWGYHSMDFGWKPTNQLVRHLVDNASNGGNYQLNVGPTGDGRFQPAAIKRLREIGCWMSANSEAIYGTTASPLGKPCWGSITARRLPKGNTRLYLHLYEKTPGTALLLDNLKHKPLCATVLESGQPVPVSITREGVWVKLPDELKGLELPVIALDVAGTVR